MRSSHHSAAPGGPENNTACRMRRDLGATRDPFRKHSHHRPSRHAPRKPECAKFGAGVVWRSSPERGPSRPKSLLLWVALHRVATTQCTCRHGAPRWILPGHSRTSSAPGSEMSEMPETPARPSQAPRASPAPEFRNRWNSGDPQKSGNHEHVAHITS